jgi:hypothetical protein
MVCSGLTDFFVAMQQDGTTVVDSPGAASKRAAPETPTYQAMCVSQAVGFSAFEQGSDF